MPSERAINYRFTGHETFPCRYSWLTKAARHVKADATLLNREDDAMVRLGLGKNMVRSLRFWALATQVLEKTEGGHRVSSFGTEIFLGNNGESGLDPYLEDVQTLWLIHWNLSTAKEEPLFGWDFLLNRWHHPQLFSSAVVDAFVQELAPHPRSPGRPTLEQMFEVFSHTYLPTRGRKGEVREDNLDCPLVELRLLEPDGVRPSGDGKAAEPMYRFRREPKPDIGPALFAYCLDQFWRQSGHVKEESLPLKDIISDHGSPGQIFKLPEDDVRSRVEQLADETDGWFHFVDSAMHPHVKRGATSTGSYPLSAIYAAHPTP